MVYLTPADISDSVGGQMILDAILGELTLAELASKYGVHQTMIAQWKRQAIEGMAPTFSGKMVSEPPVSSADVEKLHAKIGELLMGRDFLRDASARLGVIRGGR